MKILQISGGELKIPPEKGGAIELHILSISREFIKSGHSVTILDRIYTEGDLPNEIKQYKRHNILIYGNSKCRFWVYN